MKIKIRIPTDAYAFIEAEFDSVEQYQDEYPRLAAAIVETRKKAKEAVKLNEVP